MKSLVYILLLAILTGCTTFGEYSFGYPYAWKQWTYDNKKPTTIKRENFVKENMLSCGFSSTDDNSLMRNQNINNYIKASRCMESKGFKHLIYPEGICTHQNYKKESACIGGE